MFDVTFARDFSLMERYVTELMESSVTAAVVQREFCLGLHVAVQNIISKPYFSLISGLHHFEHFSEFY